MPKKTARVTKPSQQRSKEDQWRRRMAAQAQTGAGSAVAEPETTENYSDGAADATYATGTDAVTRVRPTSARTTGTSTAARTTTTARGTGTAATMQRNAARAARNRLAVSTMSIADEMHYIRADVRKLIMFTVVCLAIIIALAFIIPSVVK